jgi:glycosyltransferase involved in cell wall biosynthesis
MNKILHVIESLAPGGAEILLCNTIPELYNYEHLVVTLFASEQLSILPKNSNFVCLNAQVKSDIFFLGKKFKKIIGDFKPDVVHAHLYFATVLAKAFTPRTIPLIFTQHFEFSKNAAKWYYQMTDRILSRSSQTCIAVSKVVLNDYVATTGFRGKSHIVGNYVPDRYFNLEKNIVRTGSLRVLALGNVKPIKNQRFILDAFSLMKDLPVYCDVYGEGEERLKLEALARADEIPVYFKGQVNDSSNVLPEYDVYIMPSLTEGFPLALFESMAASLPAIVSDIPVFHELLESYGNYVSLQEPSQVRPIIEKYLENRDLLQDTGKTMKELALKKASRKSYLAKLEAVYRNALQA